MSFKLRSIAVVLAALGLSFAVFASDEQKATTDTTTTTATATTTTTTPAVETVNINTADADALAKVKGIGKKKAEAIVEYRTKNGNFKSVDDLLSVQCKGISQKWLDKVKDKLAV